MTTFIKAALINGKGVRLQWARQGTGKTQDSLLTRREERNKKGRYSSLYFDEPIVKSKGYGLE